MKGIILAGGSGTRLYPITKAISKQLLPVNDKPMIYYPLSVLMLAGIREILIITTEEDLPNFERLLGSGKSLGLELHYRIQSSPKGIPDAFIIGEDFINNEPVCLVLGDNIFHGYGFTGILKENLDRNIGCTIFGYRVNDPQRFGVVDIDESGNILSLKEKPSNPKSNIAVTGLYIFESDVISYSKKLQVSKRNELEIIDLLKMYHEENKLSIHTFGRGYAWLDTGTHRSLLEASHFVNSIEERQGLKIACIEEIAFNNGWIDDERIKEFSEKYENTDYGEYLKKSIAAFRNDSKGN